MSSLAIDHAVYMETFLSKYMVTLVVDGTRICSDLNAKQSQHLPSCSMARMPTDWTDDQLHWRPTGWPQLQTMQNF